MRNRRFGPWKNENNLRKWVAWQLGKRDVYWVEPKRGSTFGVPDCFYFNGLRGRTIWLELKIGRVVRGRMTYEVRPGQKRVLRRMVEQGISAYILVGEEDATNLFLVEAKGEIIDGSFPTADLPREIFIEKLVPGEPKSLKKVIVKR